MLVEQNESEIELQGGDIIAVRRDFVWVERNWEAIDSGEEGKEVTVSIQPGLWAALPIPCVFLLSQIFTGHPSGKTSLSLLAANLYFSCFCLNSLPGDFLYSRMYVT